MTKTEANESIQVIRNSFKLNASRRLQSLSSQAFYEEGNDYARERLGLTTDKVEAIEVALGWEQSSDDVLREAIAAVSVMTPRMARRIVRDAYREYFSDMSLGAYMTPSLLQDFRDATTTLGMSDEKQFQKEIAVGYRDRKGDMMEFSSDDDDDNE